MKFLACRIHKTAKEGIEHKLEQLTVDQLCQGEVLIRVQFSGVNYKDALAATGRGHILKRFPLNAGIDLAGVVEKSTDHRFQAGDKVIVNGCGLGESHDGGLAGMARVPADWVIPLPSGLSLKETMILGTAGFTAALAIHRMMQNGQTREKGPIVITGASGGVGSIAINILSSLGFETVALSGRSVYFDYLTALGATQVCHADSLSLGSKPLEKSRFGGVIDNVGGQLLSKLLAHTHLWGNVASIGLADSPQLDSTVFPFILRGVSLLGISSTNCPMPLRREIWQQLGAKFKPVNLELIHTEEVKLSEVSSTFSDLLDRKKHGRIVVNCQA